MKELPEGLDLRKEAGVAWLTLDRPKKLNALTWSMFGGLHDFLDSLAQDLDTKVVILRGNGRAFCAGADLSDNPYARAQMEQRSAEETSPSAGMRTQHWQSSLVLKMRRVPQPIITLVQGAAAGGGMALALASDVCIVGESASLSAAFIKVGLSGCDMGCSYFLTRALGPSMASELMLTGDPIDGRRAAELGLASRMVPDEELEEEGRRLAEAMLRNSPFGLRLTKECLRFSLDAPSLEAVIAMEDRNQTLASKHPDAAEAFFARQEKREPRFLP